MLFGGLLFSFFIVTVSAVSDPAVSIVNGQDATAGEAPYIIQIRFIDPRLHYCAGS
jgi:secreted trypsin-like serine protease